MTYVYSLLYLSFPPSPLSLPSHQQEEAFPLLLVGGVIWVSVKHLKTILIGRHAT